MTTKMTYTREDVRQLAQERGFYEEFEQSAFVEETGQDWVDRLFDNYEKHRARIPVFDYYSFEGLGKALNRPYSFGDVRSLFHGYNEDDLFESADRMSHAILALASMDAPERARAASYVRGSVTSCLSRTARMLENGPPREDQQPFQVQWTMEKKEVDDAPPHIEFKVNEDFEAFWHQAFTVHYKDIELTTPDFFAMCDDSFEDDDEFRIMLGRGDARATTRIKSHELEALSRCMVSVRLVRVIMDYTDHFVQVMRDEIMPATNDSELSEYDWARDRNYQHYAAKTHRCGDHGAALPMEHPYFKDYCTCALAEEEWLPPLDLITSLIEWMTTEKALTAGVQ